MKIETKMVETIMDNQSYYLEDFLRVKDAVSNSKAIYKGQPVPYLYIPKIYDKKDVETFESALSGMMDVVERTIGLYKTEASVRRLFGFDKRLEELILLPHDYDVTVPMGRFDIFYYGPGEYKFCELNADGASAMNEEKELSAIMRENAIVGAFESKYDFQVFELFHTWVKALGDIYLSYTKNRGIDLKPKSDTVVAIVDFIDKSSSIEFEVFKEAFIEHGYQCIIVDPRNIKTVDGKMIADGLVIDVIYRRLVTKDLMDRYDEIPDFIQGLKASETCVVGSVKTQIIHTKRFFEVLHTPEFRTYLNPEQMDFIDRHVPFTRPLSIESDLTDYVNHKDELIIKPVDYYASKGVCAGRDYSETDWAKLLEEKMKEDFIIQSYCPLSLVDNVIYNKEGKLEPCSFRTITGLFVYNGEFAGTYVRAGLNAIISGLHEGYTMSSMVVTEK
ncbi:MAG: hypothetical protein SCL54_12075 [Bacillota bacterium]|nr:hypothetical protein [Bacillota bacterium]